MSSRILLYVGLYFIWVNEETKSIVCAGYLAELCSSDYSSLFNIYDVK